MPYYEIIFETGEVAVANYVDDAEALSATKEQNDRAKTGGKNGPQEGPATRVARVLKYDEHPGEFRADGGVSADVLKTELAALVDNMSDKNGVVHVMSLSLGVQELVHPMVQQANPHDSRFKMEEVAELELKGF